MSLSRRGQPRIQLRGIESRLRRTSPAPVLSFIALGLVGILSLGLLGGPGPGLVTAKATGDPGDVPNRTPDPVKVFVPVVPQVPQVRGSILIIKAGNIWSVSGSDALSQLTTSGHDQYPSWSHDGSTIYFLALRSAQGNVPCSFVAASGCINADVPYILTYPVLARMPASGGSTTVIRSGLYSWSGRRFTFFYGLWQPAVSPDGKTVALITDGPDPFSDDYELALLATTDGRLNRASVAEDFGLGHNDPAWSPDGRVIAYTYNHRNGILAAPRIAIEDVRAGTSRFLTSYGYAEPSFSPDGRSIVAITTGARGEDVVILDASTGAVQLRVTSDGGSFQPVWSPAGDQIAFLRTDGLSIDLWVSTLSGSGTNFSVTGMEPLTSQSGLDGTSKPSWFVPGSEMLSPPPSQPSGAPGGSASP